MGDLDFIKQELHDIRSNHIDHIEDDIREIKIEQAVQGNDLKWLKKMFFIVASASVGSLVAALINLI